MAYLHRQWETLDHVEDAAEREETSYLMGQVQDTIDNLRAARRAVEAVENDDGYETP